MYMPTKCPRCRADNSVGVYAAASGSPAPCNSCGTVYDPITDREIAPGEQTTPGRSYSTSSVEPRKAS